MDTPLQKAKILITRPREQTQALSKQIKNLGGEVILLPTIEIVKTANQTLLEQEIKDLINYDLAIFISPNAVIYALPFIHKHWPTWPTSLKVGVIGESTGKKLYEQGIPVNFCPAQHFNSEAFLALPALQNIVGKKIILFKGEGGRELLASTLKARGAFVKEASVYRRQLPSEQMKLLLPKAQIDIIICTSYAGLQNLITIIGAKYRSWLLNMSLLVASERLAALAKNLGFVKSPLIADNATDTAIIDALITWQEKLHGKSTH